MDRYGLPLDIIYLDFHKDFVTVPHQRLLLNPRAHGMGDFTGKLKNSLTRVEK